MKIHVATVKHQAAVRSARTFASLAGQEPLRANLSVPASTSGDSNNSSWMRPFLRSDDSIPPSFDSHLGSEPRSLLSMFSASDRLDLENDPAYDHSPPAGNNADRSIEQEIAIIMNVDATHNEGMSNLLIH